MRSFANLWYWISLGVLWSSLSHFVMGAPFDLVQRARRRGGQFQADMDAMVHIWCRRLALIDRKLGLLMVGVAAMIATSLLTLGFAYGNEFFQAVSFLTLPLIAVFALNLRMARRVLRDDIRGDALQSALRRHRVAIQGIGIVAIFVAAMWGMALNILTGHFR